jgi:uncharacterized membrane protein
MNLAHIHIILNHVPSLGSIACLLLLVAAIYTKNDVLKKYTLLFLVLISLAVLPTYITGVEAHYMIRQQENVNPALVEVHQNAAIVTLGLMIVTGTLAWFGLWEFRRFKRAGTITSVGTLLATLITVVSILLTASLGGKISHPEVRKEADALVVVEQGWREPIELYVGSKSWMWPALETLHFIGMTMLFGVSLLLLLRMFGMMKSISFSAIHRLLPFGIIGFVVNTMTGMLFFIAGPGNYVGKQAFHIKIIGILLGGLPLFYFTIFDDPWRVGGNQDASFGTKVAAVCMFGLLVVVVVYGRLLPFLL